MYRIFIDPALASTGVFICKHDNSEVWFSNPKVTHKAEPKLSGKFVLVKLMVDRIIEHLRSHMVAGNEFYIEAPFVGSFGSTLELVGLSFMLIDAIREKFHAITGQEAKVFMLTASLVSGRDKKAKRERKLRKPFAIEKFQELEAQGSVKSVFGRETLSWGSKDDVATAFLFWYYIFGAGFDPKSKTTLDPITFNEDRLFYTSSKEGSNG